MNVRLEDVGLNVWQLDDFELGFRPARAAGGLEELRPCHDPIPVYGERVFIRADEDGDGSGIVLPDCSQQQFRRVSGYIPTCNA